MSASSSSLSVAGGEMDICLWLTLKLKKEWSSADVSSLLSPETLQNIIQKFYQLDPPIKIRTLLAFVSMRKEEILKSQKLICQLLDLAESDTDEWVKIGSGLVKRWLFRTSELPKDDFLASKLSATIKELENKVLERMETDTNWHYRGEQSELISLESPYLSKKLQPSNISTAINRHFTVVEEKVSAKSSSQDERPSSRLKSYRPAISRPVVSETPRSLATTSAGLVTRPGSSLRRENLATRRAIDGSSTSTGSRYKRQRSRISMIDIDEVKQIETEKAQKAEERKRRLSEKAGGGSGEGESSTCVASGSDTRHSNADPAGVVNMVSEKRDVPPASDTQYGDGDGDGEGTQEDMLRVHNDAVDLLANAAAASDTGTSLAFGDQPRIEMEMGIPMGIPMGIIDSDGSSVQEDTRYVASHELQQRHQNDQQQQSLPPGFGAPPSYWN